MPFATLTSVASWLPERRLTNADLEKMVDTTDEWILSRTGIRERRIADPADAVSDLAARAGTKALERAGIDPTDVDLLILATSTPDMVMPSAACLAQSKMGLSCPSFDLNAACTGFVYALHTATCAIESGRARNVLVIGADVLSSIVDYTDRATCVLFGDGAGAVLLTASEEPGVLGIHLGADGSGADLLYVPAGGSAAPASAQALESGQHHIKMNGNEVFKFAVRAIPAVTRDALAASGLSVADVDWLVPHQANQRITDTVAQRLGIPEPRVVSSIEATGNTSAASIPIALDTLLSDGHLRPGHVLALVGFGAGLTYGAAIVRWTRED